MSAFGGKAVIAEMSAAAKIPLFDHLVGEREHIVGDFYVKRLCRFEIENERKLGRLFNWQVGWLGTLKDFVHVHCGMFANFVVVGPVSYEAPGVYKIVDSRIRRLS